MDLLAHKLETQLKTSLFKLKTELSQNGVNASDAAPVSIHNFCIASEKKQNLILNNIGTYLEILSQDIEIESPKPNIKIEEARLKKALRAFNLSALDKNIFNLIDEDDVIEIYNDEGIQLYRNITFCKLCSYSLLDLAVNSWDELYDKPTAIKNKIMSKINEVMTTSEGTVAYEMSSYIQREKFIYAKTLKTFLVKPKFISPLLDNLSGRRVAMLSTYSAKILTEGTDSLNLEII
jgi:hypothetical protein